MKCTCWTNTSMWWHGLRAPITWRTTLQLASPKRQKSKGRGPTKDARMWWTQIIIEQASITDKETGRILLGEILKSKLTYYLYNNITYRERYQISEENSQTYNDSSRRHRRLDYLRTIRHKYMPCTMLTVEKVKVTNLQNDLQLSCKRK
jgi:hypothetical protein